MHQRVQRDRRRAVPVGVEYRFGLTANSDLTLRAVARNGSAWVAVGGGGVMLRSVDGITWTAVESGKGEAVPSMIVTENWFSEFRDKKKK